MACCGPETKVANILRPGAFGDVVLTSAVTSQLKRQGYCVHYYTEAAELAGLLRGVAEVHPASEWERRTPGRDYIARFIPREHPNQRALETICAEAGVPVSRMEMKLFAAPMKPGYVTLQRKAGWSSLKEYPHWDAVIAQLGLPVHEIDDSRPWAESCALIQHARLHLGVDSMGGHIAAAYQTPAVIVFGSTSPLIFGHPTATNLSVAPPACGPCHIEDKFTNGHRHGEKCPIGGCAQHIPAKSVVEAARKIMRSPENAAARPRISVLHATRRPAQAIETMRQWLDAATDPDSVEWIFAFDDEDTESAGLLSGFKHVRTIAQREHIGGRMCAAWNMAAEISTGDILVVAADDISAPEQWDRLISEQINTADETVLAVGDGARTDRLICHSIMTRLRYERYGYINHPDYDGVCADVELTEVAYRDGVVKLARQIVFEHLHPYFQKAAWDDQYRLTNAKSAIARGDAVLNHRRALGFPKSATFYVPRKVSVVMIVKNEESCIRDCLLSVKDADEIVVMDTGSQDHTLPILESLRQEFGNLRIVIGAWHDDFARARNEALAYAAGDWILSIDADETLSAGGIAKLREAMANTPGRTLKLTLSGRNSHARHQVVRAFRNGVRWVGACHEVPDCADGGECAVVITYGSSPAHALDAGRSLRILTAQHLRDPACTRTLYYLAREYWYAKDYAMALKLFTGYVNTSRFVAERADAWLYMARIHWSQSRGDAARAACLNALACNANFKEALLLMAEMSFPKNAARWHSFAALATNDDVLFVR